MLVPFVATTTPTDDETFILRIKKHTSKKTQLKHSPPSHRPTLSHTTSRSSPLVIVPFISNTTTSSMVQLVHHRATIPSSHDLLERMSSLPATSSILNDEQEMPSSHDFLKFHREDQKLLHATVLHGNHVFWSTSTTLPLQRRSRSCGGGRERPRPLSVQEGTSYDLGEIFCLYEKDQEQDRELRTLQDNFQLAPETGVANFRG